MHFREDGIWGFNTIQGSYIYLPVNTWNLNGQTLTIFGGDMHYILNL